jgi:polyisoprenoid-binding protein YceI
MEVDAGVAIMPSVATSLRMLRALFFIAFLAPAGLIPAARAQAITVHLDPAKTKIEFTLGATLHTVHGSFRLKTGEARFDPATGAASGAIVIDSASGESGNEGRDKRMHREILESDKFPEIIFTPRLIKGTLAPEGPSKLEVAGQFRLHGQDHDMTLPLEIDSGKGILRVTAEIVIPYVQWGLKSPNTFILRVSDKVTIEIHASGSVTAAAASH